MQKNLSVAALIAEGIYNFGELLAHPVLKSLIRTPDEWLIDLLKAFNAGEIDKFEALKSKGFNREPTLMKYEPLLRTKILLLSLMEMTFKRQATERQLTFTEIAKTTRLKESEVEGLVMRAISKGLVDGAIDEVARKVHMTWVQPRVLDRQQIGNMITRLDDWRKEISVVEKMMEDNAKDILLA
jgi:26S proteasome regulatory subunit N9